MIEFSKTALDNGLVLIVSTDNSTPLVAMSILYKVGARDENPERTGFAHLFEHLMFGGSKHIPSYDKPLELAGGENNAFTNNDFTNYYLTIPKSNIETAFWLESDRMLEINLNSKAIEVQKKVVVEEFNQRYLNQPYGDLSLLFRPLCYKVHPYKWPTIGKDISHIKNATKDDVAYFYKTFYNPDNAILVLVGNIKFEEALQLAKKWFEPIRKKSNFTRNIPKEPEQTEARRLEVERKVPLDFIAIGFPMCNRLDEDFYVYDMITDILSNGQGSRLHQNLVKKEQIFSSVDAYITGSYDEGQVIFSGYVLPNINIETAEKKLWEEIEKFIVTDISDQEMIKAKNKFETEYHLQNIPILDRALNLSYYEFLGNANLINTEIEKYCSVTKEDIKRCATKTFQKNKSSTLLYKAQK